MASDNPSSNQHQHRKNSKTFHSPHDHIAFAPTVTPSSASVSPSLQAEIESIAHHPSPADVVHHREHSSADHFRKAWRASQHGAQHKAPRPFKPSKIPLPRPYKKHRADIEKRRASRDFVYIRDEEHVFSARDKRVKTPCCGVLCFHALEFIDLVVNKNCKKRTSESYKGSYKGLDFLVIFVLF